MLDHFRVRIVHAGSLGEDASRLDGDTITIDAAAKPEELPDIQAIIAATQPPRPASPFHLSSSAPCRLIPVVCEVS